MRLVKRGVVVAVMAFALLAGTARADGDPASDLLITQNTFVPFQTPAASATDALTKQVDAVYANGDRVKVAVIGAKVDLGAIPSLYDKPSEYAKFLGQELSGFYIGPLLIVMPSGYGIWDGGRTTAAEDAVLAKLDAPGSTDSDALTAAATSAVEKLAQAHALKSKDILKPYVETIGATVKRKTLTVRFYLADDSGKASAVVSVLTRSKVVYSAKIASHPTSILKIESHPFVLAKAPAAGSSVCVAAADAGGNKGRSCFKLRR
jgi:hypothetical protein